MSVALGRSVHYEEFLQLVRAGHPAAAQVTVSAVRALDEAIFSDRDPSAAPLDIEIQRVGFNEWARAGRRPRRSRRSCWAPAVGRQTRVVGATV